MTTIDYAEAGFSGGAPAMKPARRGLLAAISAWFARQRKRREDRLTLWELSNFNDHLLRDIGITAADVESALRTRGTTYALNRRTIRGHE